MNNCRLLLTVLTAFCLLAPLAVAVVEARPRLTLNSSASAFPVCTLADRVAFLNCRLDKLSYWNASLYELYDNLVVAGTNATKAFEARQTFWCGNASTIFGEIGSCIPVCAQDAVPFFGRDVVLEVCNTQCNVTAGGKFLGIANSTSLTDVLAYYG